MWTQAGRLQGLPGSPALCSNRSGLCPHSLLQQCPHLLIGRPRTSPLKHPRELASSDSEAPPLGSASKVLPDPEAPCASPWASWHVPRIPAPRLGTVLCLCHLHHLAGACHAGPLSHGAFRNDFPMAGPLRVSWVTPVEGGEGERESTVGKCPGGGRRWGTLGRPWREGHGQGPCVSSQAGSVPPPPPVQSR